MLAVVPENPQRCVSRNHALTSFRKHARIDVIAVSCRTPQLRSLHRKLPRHKLHSRTCEPHRRTLVGSPVSKRDETHTRSNKSIWIPWYLTSPRFSTHSSKRLVHGTAVQIMTLLTARSPGSKAVKSSSKVNHRYTPQGQS
jgi:hypothetical protein